MASVGREPEPNTQMDIPNAITDGKSEGNPAQPGVTNAITNPKAEGFGQKSIPGAVSSPKSN